MTTKSLLDDFLSQAPQSGEFFESNFLDSDSVKDRIAKVSQRKINPLVLQEIKSQNSPLHSPAQSSIAKLEAGAVAIVTGQQLGFLGGPLLTLYKALGAITYAKHIEEKYGAKAVPIFWMQSEDHDYEEIAGAKFYADNEEVSLLSPSTIAGRVGDSVGYLKYQDPALGQALAGLVNFGFADTEQELLTSCYSSGKTLELSFAELMRSLLAEHGLLFFSPLSKTIKDYSKDFIATSFLRSRAIERLLLERTAWLKEQGYPVQVPVKEGSPLFFVAGDKGRVRLTETSEGKWVGDSLHLDKESLYGLLDRESTKFTSSALIRPLFQDFLLPSLGYIAGPSEFNYWVETKPLYPFFGIPQPLVIPRPRLTLVEEKYTRIAEKAGVKFSELNLASSEFIAQRFSNSKYDPHKLFDSIKTESTKALLAQQALMTEIDPTLQKGVEQTQSAIETNIDKLKSKYERALAQKEEAALKQFERVKRVFQPEGKTQDQVISFMYFVGKYGKGLVAELLSKLSWSSFGSKDNFVLSHTGQLTKL